MRAKTIFLSIVALTLLAGCAHSKPRFIARACANSVGTGPTVVCKHCNCLMPADAPPDGACAVCNCGYRNTACARGR